jgi:hypothetical protein
MEGGSPLLEWITYGMIACVLLALSFLALRSAWFFASLLAIPVTSVLSRSRRLGRVVRRWGERGSGHDGVPTLGPTDEAAVEEAVAAAGPQVPPVVRRAMITGGLLGAVPGLWLALRGAQLGLARGEGMASIAATVGMAVCLVGAAGLFVGGAVGVGIGLALDAARRAPSR